MRTVIAPLLLSGLLALVPAHASGLGGLPFFGGGGGGGGGGLDVGKLFGAAKAAKDAFTEVGPEEEAAIGHEGAAVLLGAAKPVADQEVQRYVNQVGRWLALHTERPDLDWRFVVLDTDTVNSFAAPGGFVIITRGLLETLDSEAELAGVLAHEIAHVVQRHYLAAVKKGARMELATTLATTASGSDRAAQVDKLVGGFKELYSRGLDKDDEFEADRMGAVIAARAGYDPYGLPAALQTLSAINPKDSSLAYMFATHPEPNQRLELLGLAMEPLDAYADQPALADRFRKVVARLKPKG